MKNDIIDLEITDITPEGFGVGRLDGRVYFVADTAVGDKIRALVLKELKNRSFAKAQEIIEPSPFRIEPDCAVSQKCGGCVFRHISYDAELDLKRSLVRQCFSRIGGMDIKVNETVSDDISEYRNKVQYPFSSDADGRVTFGYYAKRSHRIVPHSHCPLQERIFTEIGEFCAKTAVSLGISAYNEETGKGELRHLVMRKNRNGDILVCIVSAVKSNKLKKLCYILNDEFSRIIGVHLNVNKRRDNVIFGEETEHICGEAALTDVLCGKTFNISPRAFYQVNANMAEKLYLKAKELAGLGADGKILLDLYCGAGTIGISLAGENDRLCGVEIIEDAIENAKENGLLNGRKVENTLFVCGDASVGVAECRKKFGNPQIIIVDPPRKGLDKEVINTVAEAKPEKIVYISCDPATLARDCALFAELGYITNEATPFDLFPRTGHVETVVLLSKGEVDSKKIRVEFSLEDMDMSEFQDGATYPQIKEYVLEHTGLKVSNLYISQIKRKCGIEVGKNYNLPKSEGSRQPQCPPEKEKAIREAFKYFGMI